MAEATLKAVAKLAGVAPITVSRVVNGAENVALATREKVLAIIRDLAYTPNIHAAHLSRKRVNDESLSGSNDGLAYVDPRPTDECDSCVDAPRPSDSAFALSPEEGKALARELIQLRKDVEGLRKHTECIQTRVEFMRQIFRRLSAEGTHLRAGRKAVVHVRSKIG